VDTHNSLLLQAVSERAFEHWYKPLAPKHQCPHKIALHEYAVDRIGQNAKLTYLEFGVHEGASIKRFASKFRNPEARFFGFDSFVGLPESWGHMNSGHFPKWARHQLFLMTV
jgi:hypothetical protein